MWHLGIGVMNIKKQAPTTAHDSFKEKFNISNLSK
jgi:hypothetical protein